MTNRMLSRIAHWGIRLASVGLVMGFASFSQPAIQACDGFYCINADNGCTANEHYGYTGSTGTRGGATHFDCYSGTCDDHHPQCIEVPAAQLDALEQAAIAGDQAKVKSMLEEHQTLTVNIERSALQLLDCGGNVVAHVPAPATLIRELSAAAQR